MLTSFDLANVSIGTRIRKKCYISYFKNRRFKKTLECGCGVGTYTSFLKTISDYMISYDINRILVNRAKNCVSGSEFLVANIMVMPFKDECFDLVISADVLEHANDAEKALGEIARVTGKNGIAALSVPCINWNIVCKIWAQTKYSFGHNYLFRKEELLSLFKKVGFEIIYYEKIHGFFSALLEGLIVKVSSSLYGSDAVIDSQMAEITSKNRINSLLYFWGSKVLYPVFVFCETLIPKRLGFEHFVVMKKK